MRPQPVVLLACAPSEIAVLERLVPSRARVVTADSMDRAVDRIAQGVDAVICSLQFDGSRMLDLVREAHTRCPDMPMLCCRVAPGGIPDATLRAAAIAALSIGVAAFLDLAGVRSAAAELAATLLQRLP